MGFSPVFSMAMKQVFVYVGLANTRYGSKAETLICFCICYRKCVEFHTGAHKQLIFIHPPYKTSEKYVENS